MNSRYEEITVMTDTRPKIYFGKILSTSCMQQIVVTHVALPCELTEKLTSTTAHA